MKSKTKGRVDEIDIIVSKRLKRKRLMSGLSQEQLGNAADVSIQQVQKYEKAANRVSCGRLYKFAKKLEVPVNYFFEEENYEGDSKELVNYSKTASANTDYNCKLDEKLFSKLAIYFARIKPKKMQENAVCLVKNIADLFN